MEANKKYSFEGDQYLFKYLDLHKLIYFLNTENLFFSPLSYFDDPLEGISEQFLYENAKVNADRNSKSSADPSEHKEFKSNYRQYLNRVQRILFASCWFLGIRESLAMWENYSNNDSVALRFNPDSLCRLMIEKFSSLRGDDFSVMCHGKVEYFKISPFNPDDNELRNCGHKFKGFIKDLSYKHEEEFRFLLMQKENEKQYEYFEVNLGSLKNLDFIIITHPYMEDWKFNNIYTILKNNGLQDKLTQSVIPTRRQVFDLL